MTDGGSSSIHVIAHRGASRDRPENTLSSFDEALRQGCDAIELDVQLSRDGVPMVYHDRTLARAGGGRRRVAGLDYDELRRLDPGARFGRAFRGEHIPALDAVLERYGGRVRLLVEIKLREGRGATPRHLLLARKVAAAVEHRALTPHVQVLCFDADVLDELGRVAAGLGRVLNIKPPPTVGRSLERRLGSLQALSADVRTLTPRFARGLLRAGCPLYVFTCNTPARVDRAVDAGAAGIMADRPGWLARRLAGRTGGARADAPGPPPRPSPRRGSLQ